MAELNEKDRKFIVDMFTSLDVNGDGRVNLQELSSSKNSKMVLAYSVLFSFSGEVCQGMNKTSEEVQQMLSQVDKDQDGSIELNEFIEFVASIMGEQNKTGVRLKSTLQNLRYCQAQVPIPVPKDLIPFPKLKQSPNKRANWDRG